MARMKYTKPKVKAFSPNVSAFIEKDPPRGRGRQRHDDYQERCLALVRQIISQRSYENELKRREEKNLAKEREKQARCEERETRRRQKEQKLLLRREKQRKRQERREKKRQGEQQEEQQREQQPQEHVRHPDEDNDKNEEEEEEQWSREKQERAQEGAKTQKSARQHASASSKDDEDDSVYWPGDPDSLLVRYGTNRFYENHFNSVGYLDARRTYQMLENAKIHSNEDYEAARQQFLKLLGQHKAVWHPTGTEDKGVEISKIYKRNNGREYLVFMRIFPGGYRGERIVPDYMELVFHLILGRVTFTCRKRTKMMSRGSHISVAPKSTFSIRSLEYDQTAYFVLSMKRLHINSK